MQKATKPTDGTTRELAGAIEVNEEKAGSHVETMLPESVEKMLSTLLE